MLWERKGEKEEAAIANALHPQQKILMRNGKHAAEVVALPGECVGVAVRPPLSLRGVRAQQSASLSPEGMPAGEMRDRICLAKFGWPK